MNTDLTKILVLGGKLRAQKLHEFLLKEQVRALKDVSDRVVQQEGELKELVGKIVRPKLVELKLTDGTIDGIVRSLVIISTGEIRSLEIPEYSKNREKAIQFICKTFGLITKGSDGEEFFVRFP